MLPQWHFDVVPGIAAGTHGHPLCGLLVQVIAPPGCCQLVQSGSARVEPTLGQTTLSTSKVTS
jgi:hypothetical protein